MLRWKLCLLAGAKGRQDETFGFAQSVLCLLPPAVQPRMLALTEGQTACTAMKPQAVQDRRQTHPQQPAGRVAQSIPGTQARPLREAFHSSDIMKESVPVHTQWSDILETDLLKRGQGFFCRLSAVLLL